MGTEKRQAWKPPAPVCPPGHTVGIAGLRLAAWCWAPGATPGVAHPRSWLLRPLVEDGERWASPSGLSSWASLAQLAHGGDVVTLLVVTFCLEGWRRVPRGHRLDTAACGLQQLRSTQLGFAPHTSYELLLGARPRRGKMDFVFLALCCLSRPRKEAKARAKSLRSPQRS